VCHGMPLSIRVVPLHLCTGGRSSSISTCSQGVEEHQVREVLKCLVHTILFNRALGHVSPRDCDLQLINVSYAEVDDEAIERQVRCDRVAVKLGDAVATCCCAGSATWHFRVMAAPRLTIWLQHGTAQLCAHVAGPDGNRRDESSAEQQRMFCELQVNRGLQEVDRFLASRKAKLSASQQATADNVRCAFCSGASCACAQLPWPYTRCMPFAISAFRISDTITA
jgi:Autophagy-related protein 101